MAISNNYQVDVNQSTDNEDYQAAFCSKAMRLIIAGHKNLVADASCDRVKLEVADEPVITGELVRFANKYIDDPLSPEWAVNWHVVDEAPENTKGRLGKRRTKVDIVCTLTGRRPQKRMKFEAKRLKRNPSYPVSVYLGKDGLGMFLGGNYAPESHAVGMLGYVQSDDCDFWAQNLDYAIRKKRQSLHLCTDGCWKRVESANIPNSYETRHLRPENDTRLLVYHLLLDCVGKAD